MSKSLHVTAVHIKEFVECLFGMHVSQMSAPRPCCYVRASRESLLLWLALGHALSTARDGAAERLSPALNTHRMNSNATLDFFFKSNLLFRDFIDGDIGLRSCTSNRCAATSSYVTLLWLLQKTEHRISHCTTQRFLREMRKRQPEGRRSECRLNISTTLRFVYLVELMTMSFV
jgi:hypothetical protein